MQSGRHRHRRSRPGGALRLPEFRAIALAGLLSVAGDQLARVALSVLVYRRTSSALLTGLTYALTFLPALVGGPLLSGLADRRPRRQVMLTADLARAVLVAVMALPHIPLPALLALLVAVNVLESPFDAARAALVPDVTGERYLAALVVDRTLQQSAQVAGFAGAGLLLLVVSPQAALLADAASFLVSALLLRRRVVHRAAAVDAVPAVAAGASAADDAEADRARASTSAGRLRRAVDDARVGWAVITADHQVRTAVLLTWLVSAFAIVPEGLAAPYAHQLGGGSLLVGLLLAANPVGNVVSGLPASRWLTGRPERLLAPLAQLTALPLAVCALRPPAAAVLLLVALSGAGMTVSLLARTVFVAHVPDAARGRAFAVAGTGIIAGQGLAVAAAGAAADAFAASTVVGAAGVLCAATAVFLLRSRPHEAPPRASVAPRWRRVPGRFTAGPGTGG